MKKTAVPTVVIKLQLATTGASAPPGEKEDD